MSIDGVSGRTSYIGTSIINLRNQLNDLTTAARERQGLDDLCRAGRRSRLCAQPARAGQRASTRIADTATNVNTRLSVVNLALQGMSDIGKSVKSAATSSTIVLNNNGQTSGQITAQAAFSNAVSLLNSQSGDRYLFSGRATDTAGDRVGRRHARRQRDAGRVDAVDQRAPAGRSGRRQHGASRRLVAAGDDDRDQPRRRRLVVRLEARRHHLVADGRDRDAAGRCAAVGDGRSRRRQSERRRQDHVQFQSARRHQRDDLADRDHDEPAAGRLVPDRRRHRRDDGESAGGADVVDPDARRYRAGRGIGDRGVGQFLQSVGNDQREAPSTTRPRSRRRSPAPRCLSGAAATDSLATSFAAGDTITVNGTPITFVASGATGNQLNITDSVQTLLAKIEFDLRRHDAFDRQRRRDHAAWRQTAQISR